MTAKRVKKEAATELAVVVDTPRPVKKMGRPSPGSYRPELAQTICDRIADGESLLSICREADMPKLKTVFRWLLDADKEWFYKEYEKAKNVQAEHMFEQLLEIADDGTNDMMIRENGDGSVSAVVNKEVINRSRLRVDTRKWYLSKVLPKKFGDKLDLTTDGKSLPAPLLGGATKDD